MGKDTPSHPLTGRLGPGYPVRFEGVRAAAQGIAGNPMLRGQEKPPGASSSSYRRAPAQGPASACSVVHTASVRPIGPW